MTMTASHYTTAIPTLTFHCLRSRDAYSILINDSLIQRWFKTFTQRPHESRRAAIFVFGGGAIAG